MTLDIRSLSEYVLFVHIFGISRKCLDLNKNAYAPERS